MRLRWRVRLRRRRAVLVRLLRIERFRSGTPSRGAHRAAGGVPV
ncbi:MAG: hypothetical protein ACREM1_20560 [Longimicrobiales bacterium]